MQKYYTEIQKSKETEDSKNWKVMLANATVEDVQSFQKKALPWIEW